MTCIDSTKQYFWACLPVTVAHLPVTVARLTNNQTDSAWASCPAGSADDASRPAAICHGTGRRKSHKPAEPDGA